MKRLFLLAVLLLTFGSLSAQGVAELEARAAKGDVEAQVALGDYYFEGENVDFAKAAEWYMKAAQQNDPKGQYGLAYCYFLGAGIKPDLDEALVWFKRSAGRGNAQAHSYLGFMYLRGIGVKSDYDVAVRHLVPQAPRRCIARRRCHSRHCRSGMPPPWRVVAGSRTPSPQRPLASR